MAAPFFELEHTIRAECEAKSTELRYAAANGNPAMPETLANSSGEQSPFLYTSGIIIFL